MEHNPPPNIPTSHKLRGKAWVIDGDTIVVSKTKVRLAGIDAPELDQPWGQKSKWEMVKICKGKTIDVELTGETTYDRLVGTCFLEDGTDIGAELIKAGLALDGGHFSHGKYRHLEPEGVRKRLRFYGHWRK
ncbi:thermonuclease family protein [Gelidibacter sp. F2691]|nr:thermonuclease family protein [Gelidibacter sp. F2691]